MNKETIIKNALIAGLRMWGFDEENSTIKKLAKKFKIDLEKYPQKESGLLWGAGRVQFVDCTLEEFKEARTSEYGNFGCSDFEYIFNPETGEGACGEFTVEKIKKFTVNGKIYTVDNEDYVHIFVVEIN